MHFGIIRVYSVKIGNLKKFRMPSGKRRVHTDSGRHDDDRWRNAPCVFRKASETFLNFWSLPIFTDISRRLPKCIIPLLRLHNYSFGTVLTSSGKPAYWEAVFLHISLFHVHWIDIHRLFLNRAESEKSVFCRCSYKTKSPGSDLTPNTACVRFVPS